MPPSPPGPPRPTRLRVDLGAVERQALGCTKCRLAESRTQVVWADGNLDSKLLFIGEAPGRNEDLEGRPFVGAAGQLLDRLLAEIGLDRTGAAIANVIKCRPPGNRDPLPDEIEACSPWLQAQLAHMQPDVIVTLGNFATKFILQSPIGITRARGQVYYRNGSAIVPTFHPAAALRGGRFGGMDPVDAIREDLRVAAKELAKAAAAATTQTAPDPEPEPEPSQLGFF
ncbi:MAG: uracil-DNA glycosylase [Actinomycetota bacterium]|nr:uracil-DNA glycosylase [Actinomycetota bacterium]